MGGYSEFENCNNVNNINLSDGTNIPEYSFKGAASLSNLYANGSPVVPSTIGASAFEGATNLYKINLSATTTIGEAAFKNCTKLEGVYDSNKQIYTLDVNATTIGASAFEGTNLQYVKFANLTTVNKNLLKATGRMAQMKFAQKVTFADDVYADSEASISTFGNSTNVTLFVNPEQETLANKLIVKNSKGKTVNVTFKTIIKE